MNMKNVEKVQKLNVYKCSTSERKEKFLIGLMSIIRFFRDH